MAEHYSPQVLAEIARCRREMLHHLSKRTYHLSRRAMAAFKQAHDPSTEGRARKVWRDLIRADMAPKRDLYVPGRR